ncbi:MAG: hypothetical protein SGI99_18550 [Pseudomonadota bacterium]|nr:hypothetical protein [Pseudomonadota bacterium]
MAVVASAYRPLIHALRNDLTLLHVQHCNTGSITGADDRARVVVARRKEASN